MLINNVVLALGVQHSDSVVLLLCVSHSVIWLFATHGLYPLGSSVHGIFQVKILASIAILFSRASSQPKDWTHVSCIDKQILYHCATWEINETNILERGDAILHMPGKRRNRILANTPNGSHVCLWNKSTLGSVEEFTSYRQINAQNNRLKSN